MEAALRGLAQNSRDVGFVLLYTTDRDSVDDFSREASDSQSVTRTAGTDCGSAAYGSTVVADEAAVGEEESEIALTLVGAMGAIDLEGPGNQVPRTLTSHRLQAVNEYDQSKLTNVIRLAHSRDELVLLTDDEMDAFEGCLTPNVFGDIPRQAAVIPIKASAEDRCHGILVIGLSTRLNVSHPPRAGYVAERPLTFLFNNSWFSSTSRIPATLHWSGRYSPTVERRRNYTWRRNCGPSISLRSTDKRLENSR